MFVRVFIFVSLVLVFIFVSLPLLYHENKKSQTEDAIMSIINPMYSFHPWLQDLDQSLDQSDPDQALDPDQDQDQAPDQDLDLDLDQGFVFG